MNQPLLPTFTQIPNIILDDWMMNLSGSAYKIVSVIARQTYGWILDKNTGRRKVSDWISYSQFSQKTGLKNEAIAKALKELEDGEYISITDSKGLQIDKSLRNGKKLYYRINNRTFPKTEEVATNLSENRNSISEETKETYTKETIYNTKVLYIGDSPLEKVDNRNTDITELITLMKTYTQHLPREQLNRYAIKRLITAKGKDRVIKALQFAMKNREDRFCPSIANFLDLEDKWMNLETYAKRAIAGTKGGVNNKHYDASEELRKRRLANQSGEGRVLSPTG